MTVKLGKVENYRKGLPPLKSTRSSDHVTDKIISFHYISFHYISFSARPMATRLDRVVGYNAGLLSTKSDNLLTTGHRRSYNKQKTL